MQGKDPESSLWYKEPEPSDLKIQETKILATHPLEKHPQKLFGQKEKYNQSEQVRQSKALYISY